MEREVVWLIEQRCFAFLTERGAWVSDIMHEDGTFEVVENDEYEFWEERTIDFEPDDTDE